MGLMTSEISARHLAPVCRQMATSYDAGLPILRTLELLGKDARDARSRQVFQEMAADIRQGSTLGEAARRHHKYLPRFFIELLHSGETGGRLDIMLRDLAEYYEDRIAMQRKIVGAMVYPTLQLAAAWFLGTFSLGIIGKINVDSTEPFSLERYFAEYVAMQGLAMGLFAAAFLAIVALSRMGLMRWGRGQVVNRIWPLNVVSRKFSLARFFRSMSLLIGSGMNMKSCIANSAAIAGNAAIERDLLQAIPRVADGHTLVEAFAGCRSLTPLARDMLAVGEQSGDLEGSLKKVSEYHFNEAQHAVNVATKVMGVGIVLAVAAVVGYIIISFYSKYFGMLNSIG